MDGSRGNNQYQQNHAVHLKPAVNLLTQTSNPAGDSDEIAQTLDTLKRTLGRTYISMVLPLIARQQAELQNRSQRPWLSCARNSWTVLPEKQ